MIPVGILAAAAVRRGTGPGPGPASVTLTVPPQVEAMVGFPLYVDLTTMPAGFWDDLAFNDGRDLRASTPGGQPLPLDVVRCDRAAQTGELFVRCDLSDSAPTEVVLDFGDPSRSAPVAHESPVGRNAVWADYNRAYMLGEPMAEDRTGGHPGVVDELVTDVRATNIGARQGICWDGTHYYATDDNLLRKYDSDWNLVAENPNPTASVAGTDHCGDPDVANGVLYVPVEQWTSASSFSRMHIARFRASDLTFIDATDVSAQDHEVASIAVEPGTGDLFVASYVDGSRLFVYSPGGTYKGEVTLSETIPLIQGIAFHGGRIFFSSDTPGSPIWTAAPDGSGVDPCFWKGAAGTFGGLAVADGRLLVLIYSSGGNVHEVRPGGTFRIPADRFEAWTMAVTATNTSAATNTSRGIVSYGHPTNSSSNTHRSTVAIRSSTGLGVGMWNSSQSWLNSSGDKMDVGVQRRVHGVHDGTAYRAVYVEGQETRQVSAALRPADGPVALFLGRSDNGPTERFVGELSGLCYLREGALSPAWIAAETANLAAPGDFYEVN